MRLKISQKNGLNLTRDQVYDVDADLEGLRQKKRKKAHLLQLDQIRLYLGTVTIS